jgi:protein-tyrosine phosphatase
VVDLRTAKELEVWPDELHGLDVEYVNLPLLPDRDGDAPDWPQDQVGVYRLMAEVGGRAVAAAVRALAAGTPVLVHCAVGKDRTGLAIAVIQHLVGLSETEIVDDFLRSNPALGLDAGPVPYTNELGEQHNSRPVDGTHLLAALARIRELHGSVVSYLSAHGVSPAELAAVHALRLS